MHKYKDGEKGDFIKISVITVTLNSVKTIERSISSVLSQDYKEKEYIVIDGASSDGTIEIIKKYKNQIDFWVSEPDKGIFNAMNKGISKCTGEIITFMNSDDWYCNNSVLTRVAELYSQNKYDILCGAAALIYNNEIVATRKPGKDSKKIWLENIYVHQAMFCRKELFEKYGVFKEEYKLGGDYEWNLRMYCLGIKFKTTDDNLVNYSLNGLSGTNSVQLSEEFKAIALSKISFLRKEYSLEDVINFHNWKICFYNNERILEEKARLKDDKLRKLFHKKEYYIWGTGKMGILSYRILNNLEIKICGFIDNNIISNTIMDCPVFKPEQVDYSKGICISVLDKPEEIIQQIENINQNSKNCIVFRSIVENLRI